MTQQMRFFRTLALALVMALIATACGGGGDTVESADSAQPSVNFDGESDDTSVVGAIPTTAPLTIDTIETDADSSSDSAPEAAPAADDTTGIVSDENPWEVDVLHVNDDVATILTFDGPNGNVTTLVDVNGIDGTRTEYPLNAETVFGNRLALLVDEFDSTGNWAKVFVPIRPNGSTAWVQTAFFTKQTHDYHIEISLSQNKVNVFQGETLLVEQISVLGRDSRPTPVLRSYIDEKIRGESLSPAYGDWILSIASYSEALPTFGGGLPKLALHGTNEPELMGQYVSSGCIRVPNEVISFIAESVPVGTVVDIVA